MALFMFFLSVYFIAFNNWIIPGSHPIMCKNRVFGSTKAVEMDVQMVISCLLNIGRHVFTMRFLAK